MTVKFDTTSDGYDRTKRDDGTDRPGNWQVIFKTISGHDYCRETKPGTMSRDDIMAWTLKQVGLNNLGGAVIERW